MLGAGYYFEAKGGWRPWSLAMMAGGFAVLYVTAYAAHTVEAAKVFDDHTVGALLQAGIACAAVWQAVRFANEAAVLLAFLAAYGGVLASDAGALRFLGGVPLTLAMLWLAERNLWDGLRWGAFGYGWMSAWMCADSLPDDARWGQPGTWFTFGSFLIYEIWSRVRGAQGWHAIWLAGNALLCFFVHTSTTRVSDDGYGSNVLALLVGAGFAAGAARIVLGVRREALGEALSVLGGALWLAVHYEKRDALLGAMLVMALAMGALLWNRREPTLALGAAGEVVLAMAAAFLLVEYPDSKVVWRSFWTIHSALPQTAVAMLCLFAAGRWLSAWPWPSWMALIALAEITLWTAPKTLGTILLALEAIIAVAAGLYLDRRPIRLGGLALFAFAVLKVFLYDLATLDTLPRIFSFIVLGALLLGASWGYTRYRRELQRYL
jgi:hypothetical protein